jgi:hypothetical protein
MPVVSWIDALRQYNAGMPSWCVPRKGTPAYEMVMRIRQGEKAKSFKELTAELERKTGGKPKTEKRSATINLAETKDVATVPTIADEATKTERKESTQKMSQQKTMAVIPVNYVAEGGSAKTVAKSFKEIEAQVREEVKAGKVSVDYPLGWKPETTEYIRSLANRDTHSYQVGVYKALLVMKETPKTMEIEKIKEYIKNLLPRDEDNRKSVASAMDLISEIEGWRPENAYVGTPFNYNTKTKATAKTLDEDTKRALEDYQTFAEEVNASLRKNPIRNITIRSKFYPDGKRTLVASWDTDRYVPSKDTYITYARYKREYQLRPEFKLIKGPTPEQIREEQKKFEEEEKERETQKEKKKAEKEADPLRKLKAEADDLQKELDKVYHQVGKDKEKRELTKKLKAKRQEIKEMQTARLTATDTGKKIKELMDEKKELEKRLMRKTGTLTAEEGLKHRAEMKKVQDRIKELTAEIAKLRKEAKTT